MIYFKTLRYEHFYAINKTFVTTNGVSILVVVKIWKSPELNNFI